MKTNLDLVRFCKKAHNEKWGYVWGTFGRVLTQWLFEQKLEQYPAAVGRYKSFIKNTWLNRRTADCVGLIKGALWDDDGRIKYDANSDCNANMMIVRSTKTGPMDTMPDIPGILVWKRGHIGVYVGNAQVIEANSTKKGVIMTPLTGPGSTKWTKWGMSKYFKYVESDQPELKVVYKTKQRVTFLGTTQILDVENIDGHVKLDADDLRKFGLEVRWDQQDKTVVVKLPTVKNEENRSV